MSLGKALYLNCPSPPVDIWGAVKWVQLKRLPASVMRHGSDDSSVPANLDRLELSLRALMVILCIFCGGNGIASVIDCAVQYCITWACAVALYVFEVNAIVDTYDIVFLLIMTSFERSKSEYGRPLVIGH